MKGKRGFTLIEMLLALIVLGTISIIYLKYEVLSIRREQMLKLASLIQSIDKGFYSASSLVNYPIMPVVQGQCDGGNYCLFAGGTNLGFIENLIHTSTWINDPRIQHAPTNFPQNFLDPSLNLWKLLQNYNIVIFATPDGSNYDIDEMEITKTDGRPFSKGEIAILFSYLGQKMCVGPNGNIHYFLNNTVLSNVSASNLNCPGSVSANYYTIMPEQ